MNISFTAPIIFVLLLSGCDFPQAQAQNDREKNISAEMKLRHNSLQKEIQQLTKQLQTYQS